MFFPHTFDKLIYPAVVLGLLIAVSYHPRYHLRRDMPPGFYEPSPTITAAQKRLEERVAWAYWESALMDVQWKYPHGHPLPYDPPPEFQVNALALEPVASDPVTRQVYWRRLQHVWYDPDTWAEDYDWDWEWANQPVISTTEWFRDKVGRMFR
ncbi:MAG: hypothetical protein JO356_18890 [Acidobacteria bacterium]|nr:hypothetical protein [Acidobacteriota bacterium]